jgi:predicted nucleic acid-binding Zn ribbon protein
MAKDDAHAERLGAVLEKSLKRLDLAPRLNEYGVWRIWNDVVGKPIARNAQPEKIRNGTLFVKVTSPVWMQQLQYMKEMIAEKLNQRLKGDIVRNIFFVVGRVDGDSAGDVAGAEEAKDGTAKSLDAAPVPGDEEFLASIQEPEIRQAFKRLLRSYRRRKAGA